jgi:CRISPR-associated protein Cmr5
MDKRRIDNLIPMAYSALKDSGIAKDGQIDNGYRGQIASFGASVAMGSLLSAIGFFSAKGQSDVDRQRLMEAIRLLIAGDEPEDLFHIAVKKHKDDLFREDVLNAAVALKLAMNLYKLVDKPGDPEAKGAVS